MTLRILVYYGGREQEACGRDGVGAETDDVEGRKVNGQSSRRATPPVE